MSKSALHKKVSLWARLGPGLITGAADDDPSGIATYSQVGAGFGYPILWTALFTYPLMVGIQTVSALIGRVTGQGLAANIRRHYPPWLLYSIVLSLLLANTINIAADIGAMGAALKLLIGGPAHWYAIAFGVVSLTLQVFISFPRYAPLLKALTMALLAYVATLFIVKVPWGDVVLQTLWPSLSLRPAYLVAIVAVFGTTISPYLFFWQASQEVEDQRAAPGAEPLIAAPEQAREELQRIRIDTYVGMGLSNLVAFCIMLTAVVTLHLNGTTDIQTSAQAAQALRPLAGDFAFVLFAAGIVGTGLLAVPILAGFNSGEIRSLRVLLPPAPANAAAYEEAIRGRYGDLADYYLKLYPAGTIDESMLANTRDALYGWTSTRLAIGQTAIGQRGYLYLFDHG